PMAPSQDSAKPWEFNPVIVGDGKVFVLPNDGKHLLIYDAASGDEVKRINREIEYNGDTTKLTMLLSVMGEKLLVAGRDGDGGKEFYLNWQTYAQKKPEDRQLDVDSTLWTQPVAIRGRPFVTRDTAFLPSEKALVMVNLNRGKAFLRYPREMPENGPDWPVDEGPGNVLVTQDHVIIANARNVSVYTDLQAVRQKYDIALKADPSNAEPRLHFSELMFNARELDEARKTLDEAIEVLGGLNSMRAGAMRERVFSDALTFAQKLGAEKTDSSVAMAEELFDRAAAAA